MKTPATAIEKRPMPIINWRANSASPPAAAIWKKRKSARNAQLVSAPARSVPTIPGASP